LLFNIISARYERATLAITTNLAFEQWTQIFPDTMTAGAVIDRLIHHGTILQFARESHRLRTRKGGKGAPAGQPPPRRGSNLKSRYGVRFTVTFPVGEQRVQKLQMREFEYGCER
jgi:IstB-like ATP binding protein